MTIYRPTEKHLELINKNNEDPKTEFKFIVCSYKEWDWVVVDDNLINLIWEIDDNLCFDVSEETNFNI